MGTVTDEEDNELRPEAKELEPAPAVPRADEMDVGDILDIEVIRTPAPGIVTVDI